MSPYEILNNLAVAYRHLGGLDVAHDPALRAAEELITKINKGYTLGALGLQQQIDILKVGNDEWRKQCEFLKEERDTAMRAYRELLLKYDRIEGRVQK